MKEQDANTFQSVRLLIKGLDSVPLSMMMNQAFQRENGEYFFYDTQKNVLTLLVKDGTLHLNIRLARNEKD